MSFLFSFGFIYFYFEGRNILVWFDLIVYKLKIYTIFLYGNSHVLNCDSFFTKFFDSFFLIRKKQKKGDYRLIGFDKDKLLCSLHRLQSFRFPSKYKKKGIFIGI